MRPVGVVAVGDSLTEGVGDPTRDGLRGWVHHLADAGAGRLSLVANLARHGTTVAGLRHRQLDRAVALAPDVVTCVIGVNDVIDRRFAAATFEEHYDHVVDALTAAASTGVLTMTLHDVAAGIPLPRGSREALRRRTEQANSVIERVSRRHGAWLIDAGTAAPMPPAGMLSIDRLHPNRRGHRFLAALALDVLRAHGVAVPGPAAAVPPADPLAWRIAAGARHLRWLGQHIARPLVRTLR